MGPPIDEEKRRRILEIRAARPDLRTHQAIATEAGCSRRMVAETLGAPLKPPRGTRMVVPAELVARAQAASGLGAAPDEEHVLAVLRSILGAPNFSGR